MNDPVWYSAPSKRRLERRVLFTGVRCLGVAINETDGRCVGRSHPNAACVLNSSSYSE